MFISHKPCCEEWRKWTQMKEFAGNRNLKNKSLFKTQEQETEVQAPNRTEQRILHDWTVTQD